MLITDNVVFSGNVANLGTNTAGITLAGGLAAWPYVRWAGYNTPSGGTSTPTPHPPHATYGGRTSFHLRNNHDITMGTTGQARPPETPDNVWVTFNINNGTAWQTPLSGIAPVVSSLIVGDQLNTVTPVNGFGIPTPTRTGGWSFTGWNTAANGSGTNVLPTDVINAATTLYAQWSQGTVQLTLNIVNTTGIPDAQIGTASVSAAGGTPATTNTHAATMQVPINGNVTISGAVSTTITNHTWYQVDVRIQHGATDVTFADIGTNPLPGTHNPMPMPSANVTVTVTFRVRCGWALDISDIHYGMHAAQLAGPTLTLAQARLNSAAATDPATVPVRVRNGDNATSWRLEVRSETQGGSGFAQMLVVNDQPIFETDRPIVATNSATGVVEIPWNNLAGSGIGVQIGPSSVAMANGGSQTATLTWTIVSGP